MVASKRDDGSFIADIDVFDVARLPVTEQLWILLAGYNSTIDNLRLSKSVRMMVAMELSSWRDKRRYQLNEIEQQSEPESDHESESDSQSELQSDDDLVSEAESDSGSESE